MKPWELSNELNRIASMITRSQNPSKSRVAADLSGVLRRLATEEGEGLYELDVFTANKLRREFLKIVDLVKDPESKARYKTLRSHKTDYIDDGPTDFSNGDSIGELIYGCFQTIPKNPEEMDFVNALSQFYQNIKMSTETLRSIRHFEKVTKRKISENMEYGGGPIDSFLVNRIRKAIQSTEKYHDGVNARMRLQKAAMQVSENPIETSRALGDAFHVNRKTPEAIEVLKSILDVFEPTPDEKKRIYHWIKVSKNIYE